MNQPAGVCSLQTFKWPRDDVGDRALRTVEVYHPTHVALEIHDNGRPGWSSPLRSGRRSPLV